jgi:DNA-binding MarR family transcriptional regulator
MEGFLAAECRAPVVAAALRAGRYRALYIVKDTRLVSKVAGYVNMADIINDAAGDAAAGDSEEAVRQGIELLFFAYRDFTAEPDAILEEYGFGRAHHRIVHFVGRHPHITVGELLEILRITKQSLNRVLGELVRQGFIVQHRGAEDRRQRLLELTERGRELEQRLSAPQRARVGAAYEKSGAGAVEGFRKVLLSIIADEADRQRFAPRRPPRR